MVFCRSAPSFVPVSGQLAGKGQQLTSTRPADTQDQLAQREQKLEALQNVVSIFTTHAGLKFEQGAPTLARKLCVFAVCMISCAAPTLVPSHIEHPENCHADVPNRLKFVFTCVDPKDEAAEFSFAVEVQDKLGATSYAGAHPSHAKVYCYAHALAKWDCAMQIAPCVHTVSLVHHAHRGCGAMLLCTYATSNELCECSAVGGATSGPAAGGPGTGKAEPGRP